jgi:benzoyl-CoA reductase/2-hydroxyglutaryl-CoA dehydratase subunit BcrC/BadD/HgdB
MSECCGSDDPGQASTCGGAEPAAADCPLTWFGRMIPNCLEYAKAAKAEGRPVVGIMCEYTPRELILAAGAVPVCLCGGSAKTIPAAEEELPTNLCPLIKSTYGYHRQHSNPFLEMADLLVAETTCDGKKKMYELLARSHALHVLELPQKPDDPDAFVHWQRELEKLKDVLEASFGCTITEGKLREAIEQMNQERRLRRRLAGLMADDAPPLTGRELLDLKSSISGIPADLEQYEKALQVLPGRTAVPDAAERVRVLLTGVPTAHGAERVVDLIEAHGGLIVCMENCTGVKPVLEDVQTGNGDLMAALATKYFHLPCSVMTPNAPRLDSLRALAVEYRAQCVIELIWQACLTYDVESAKVRQFAERDLGLPHLRIETDYSPSDSARIAVRVEALFETIRGRAQ